MVACDCGSDDMTYRSSHNRCECTASDEINVDGVCTACPANSSRSYDKTTCNCSKSGYSYDADLNECLCEELN